MQCGCGWLKVLEVVRMWSLGGTRCGVYVIGWR